MRTESRCAPAGQGVGSVMGQSRKRRNWESEKWVEGTGLETCKDTDMVELRGLRTVEKEPLAVTGPQTDGLNCRDLSSFLGRSLNPAVPGLSFLQRPQERVFPASSSFWGLQCP